MVWALAAGLSAWAHLALMVPRLPEPDDPGPTSEAWRKPAYADLATPRLQVLALVLGAAAGLLVASAPPHARPLLVVLAGPVATLVLVDALTTYLPRLLSWWCWALAVFGLLAGPLSSEAVWLPLLLRCAGAAALSAIVFWLGWRFGGMGFGDVRLAPVLALGAAAISWQAWWWSIFTGTVLGALWGVTVSLWRRRHPHALGGAFAYGPCLWLGLWCAVAAS